MLRYGTAPLLLGEQQTEAIVPLAICRRITRTPKLHALVTHRRQKNVRFAAI